MARLARMCRRLQTRQAPLAAVAATAAAAAFWHEKSAVDSEAAAVPIATKHGVPRRNTAVYSSFLTSRRMAEEELRKNNDKAARNPYTVSVGAAQGLRHAMEDEYRVANGGRFAALFDGHGGHRVSELLRNQLFDSYNRMLLRRFWEELDEDAESYDNSGKGDSIRHVPSISSMVAAMHDAMEEMEHQVITDRSCSYQGSTAVAVVVHTSKDGGERTLLSANVGDSRAILSRTGRAIDLTVDHKPNHERERKRIIARGGKVDWDSHAQVHRVRNLSLSRAIGDSFAKPIVTSDPDIRHFPVVEGEDEFVLLASDGLWDVMTSQEVVDFVHETLDKSAGKNATERAVARENMGIAVTKEALLRGTSDNVCVVLVWLS